jgi:hypothetical protein
MAGLGKRVDGIDVYQQNNANWPGVADLNVSIGIAKAWHETDFGDTKFRDFWPAMRNAGLIRGAYLLLAPQRDLNRQQIEALVQNFTDRIDAVGGLEPGDLPPMLDYEGSLPPGGTVAARRVRALDQLAWACNKLVPYTQTAMRRADALPMIYTGSAVWIDSDVLNDPTAAAMSAYVTNDANVADRVHIDFTRFPLWWSYVHRDPNVLDLTKASDRAVVPYPKAWPGPRSFFFQFSGHMPFPPDLGGQSDHDANVIAAVDEANTLSIPTDFSPLLNLANVAPPTSDIVLSRVTDLSDQPPDQVFSLLLIGQGFWPDEFPQIVQQGLFGRFTIAAGLFGGGGQNVHARQGIADIAPLNLLAANAGKNALACYFDAGTHADGTGLSLLLRQEHVRGTGRDPITGNPIVDPATGTPITFAPVDGLRIGHPPLEAPQVLPAGRTLAEYLSHLTVRLADGTVRRATEFWPVGERRTGAKGSLIAILRRAPFLTHNNTNTPPEDPRPAELYQLDPTTDDQVPFVAVNVVPGGDWPLLLARAIAQNLAGVTDEYELEGDGFAQPSENVVNPLAPNIVVIDDAQRQALIGGTAPATAALHAFAAWAIPNTAAVDFIAHADANANPIPAWDGVTHSYGLGDFHLIEGGCGFRTHVVRCDRDCLMRRIPAAVSNTVEAAPSLPPALPIQSTMRVFCKACEQRLRSVILGRTRVTLEPRVEIDAQRRLFDSLAWPIPTTLDAVTIDLASAVTTAVPRWSCRAEFAGPAGFRFTDINLVNVDYWAPATPPHVGHVLKSVTFENLAVEFSDGKVVILSISDALKPAARPHAFDASAKGDSSGRYQVGARLSLSWLVVHSARHTCIVDAELSLVLAAMDNDVDPGGIMMACRIYPQIAMRVRKVDSGTKPIATLRGTITIEANNADSSNLAGALHSIAAGKLTTSLFCESNRASTGGGAGAGAALDNRKRAALRSMKIAHPDRLMPPPHWSWIYDYCNAAIGSHVKFAAIRARRDGAAGTTARDNIQTWPPNQAATAITIHKLPRQGAYDSLCIHPDRGNDASGQPIVAAPVCADLGLHLHWRRGVSWTGGRAPLHLFRGWGEGRLGQGARTVLGAPIVPPNQHVDIEVTPAVDRSTVTVKYSVTASEIARDRWQVFLEQGLAYAFQYAVEHAVAPERTGLSFLHLGWLAEAMSAGDMGDVASQLMRLAAQPVPLDAAVRDVWLSVLKRVRRFDTTIDGSAEQQIPDGTSDPTNLENL